ncbi:hypothetical protein TI39_contig4157g00002 [Zymoseptoria brevis]|uniref:Retrovirus-related Pol polyprotein from transposon TNT 1-94-like beta-barrel domain-containing protein n=1 Tax=Zymoseptoria brevis TaxID=1047168 RepID=A0A0F4GBP8_9PEZI|nr:hypothetical protein TI39_contig4157g00002 [Zymoseptoria brevis]
MNDVPELFVQAVGINYPNVAGLLLSMFLDTDGAYMKPELNQIIIAFNFRMQHEKVNARRQAHATLEGQTEAEVSSAPAPAPRTTGQSNLKGTSCVDYTGKTNPCKRLVDCNVINPSLRPSRGKRDSKWNAAWKHFITYCSGTSEDNTKFLKFIKSKHPDDPKSDKAISELSHAHSVTAVDSCSELDESQDEGIVSAACILHNTDCEDSESDSFHHDCEGSKSDSITDCEDDDSDNGCRLTNREDEDTSDDPISAACLVQKVVASGQKQQKLSDSWIIDTGSQTHLVNDHTKADFKAVSKGSGSLLSGSTAFEIVATGTCTLTFETGNSKSRTLHLSNVAYCPGFQVNIVSHALLKKVGIWYHGFENALYSRKTDDKPFDRLYYKLRTVQQLICLPLVTTGNGAPPQHDWPLTP